MIKRISLKTPKERVERTKFVIENYQELGLSYPEMLNYAFHVCRSLYLDNRVAKIRNRRTNSFKKLNEHEMVITFHQQLEDF